jgi:hypothetical protein
MAESIERMRRDGLSGLSRHRCLACCLPAAGSDAQSLDGGAPAAKSRHDRGLELS